MGFGIKTKLKTLSSSFKYSLDLANKKDNEYLNVLLLCHSLEKGMGIPNVRKGYGQEKAGKLIEALSEMHNSGKTDLYEYREALSILIAYFKYQDDAGIDISSLKQKSESFIYDGTAPYHGGYQILNDDTFLKGKSIDFASFINSRHSMRTYSNEEITEDEINQVISLAKRAPSACNREPWKFYYSSNKNITSHIAESLPAQSFIADIPYVGIVTVDKTLFNANEVNQWFINGGIFSSFLILAFHSVGIGSCIFQFPLYAKSKDQLRTLLNMPENEEIICGVGFGKYPTEAKCIFADRRPNNTIVINVQ